MARNTVAGGGSQVGNPDVPLNDDARRAIAEGRLPDRDKSALVGVEVSREDYDDAMSRHGTDNYTPFDKLIVDAFTSQQSDRERAHAEERDGEASGARGRTTDTEVAPSAGSNSPRSSWKRAKSDASAKLDPRETAPTTGSNSSTARTDSSSVSSTGGPGTVSP